MKRREVWWVNFEGTSSDRPEIGPPADFVVRRQWAARFTIRQVMEIEKEK